MINTDFKRIEENFWKVHPDMKIVKPFKELWELDESKGKEDSSRMMWFIALCWDKESKYVRMEAEGEDGKYLLIGEDYMNEKWYYEERREKLDRIIDSYIGIQYTALERQVLEIEITLDVRKGVIKELRKSTNPKDWKALDSMLTSTSKVEAEIKALKERIAQEDVNGLTKGGASKSIND